MSSTFWKLLGALFLVGSAVSLGVAMHNANIHFGFLSVTLGCFAYLVIFFAGGQAAQEDLRTDIKPGQIVEVLAVFPIPPSKRLVIEVAIEDTWKTTRVPVSRFGGLVEEETPQPGQRWVMTEQNLTILPEASVPSDEAPDIQETA